MNPPVVSILIVSWNTREILRDCLRTVYEQTKNVPFEVIVVDNASADGSVEMVRTAFPQAVLRANTTNRGFAAANNQGIEVAQGRYVLLLNSDTLVLDGAIDKMVAFAEERPEAAAVACRVLNRDRTWQPTSFMFPSALNHPDRGVVSEQDVSAQPLLRAGANDVVGRAGGAGGGRRRRLFHPGATGHHRAGRRAG